MQKTDLQMEFSTSKVPLFCPVKPQDSCALEAVPFFTEKAAFHCSNKGEPASVEVDILFHQVGK